jgi:hypothetical protein
MAFGDARQASLRDADPIAPVDPWVETHGYPRTVAPRRCTISRLGFAFLLLFCFIIPLASRGADLLDEWTLLAPLPTGNDLGAVAFGNGLYVAVGNNATITTSPDGTQWTRRDSGIDLSAEGTLGLRGVAYGGGQFVAVGFGIVVTSPDGVNWTVRPGATTARLRSVTYGNGRFVAVGIQGAAVASTNGITWTATTIPGFGLATAPLWPSDSAGPLPLPRMGWRGRGEFLGQTAGSSKSLMGTDCLWQLDMTMA